MAPPEREVANSASLGDGYSMTKYFEDFAGGTEFESRSTYRVTLDEMRSFAFKWDPWPYHLDEE